MDERTNGQTDGHGLLKKWVVASIKKRTKKEGNENSDELNSATGSHLNMREGCWDGTTTFILGFRFYLLLCTVCPHLSLFSTFRVRKRFAWATLLRYFSSSFFSFFPPFVLFSFLRFTLANILLRVSRSSVKSSPGEEKNASEMDQCMMTTKVFRVSIAVFGGCLEFLTVTKTDEHNIL